MQSPSSLIFLVLLGVWAAYFVQYWVRRRDHVATARSVEQFSETMRVLDRRDQLPRTDLSEASARSYAVHPARDSCQQVSVERAVACQPGPIGISDRVDDGSGAGAPVAASASRRSPSSSVRRSPSPSPSPSPRGRLRRPVTVGARRRRVRPSRRARGLLLLTVIAGMLVIAALATASMLPWWAPAPALLAVGWAVLFVRAGARAELAMVGAHRRRQADLARRRSTAPVVPGRAHTGGARTGSAAAAAATERPVAVTVEQAAQGVEAVDLGARAKQAVVDADAFVVEPVPAEVVVPGELARNVMVPILDEDDIPLTWDPVPVPRPTYTMKAKAERPAVAPAAVTPDPSPALREMDETAYGERRVAGA